MTDDGLVDGKPNDGKGLLEDGSNDGKKAGWLNDVVLIDDKEFIDDGGLLDDR